MEASVRSTPARGLADFVYVTCGVPIGIFWLVALGALLALATGAIIVLIGIPMLMLAVLLWRWGADVERQRAALVLGAPIPRPVRRAPASARFRDRWSARLRDRTTWRDLGFMALLVPVGIFSGAIVLGLWALTVSAFAAPALAGSAQDGSWLGQRNGTTLVAFALAGVPLAAATMLVNRGLAVSISGLAKTLLGTDERAALASRISSLETTRSAAVESADARLRRIERDLHDGAQHRLAYIAMEIGRARAKLPPDDAALDELLAGAHEEAKRAMRELRDLVRGIHPSVLSDRGLDAALSGLAERATVPVTILSRLEGRLPPALETAAYYVVAEGLTNVGRHAGARGAEVEIDYDGAELVLAIRDDGVGGAQRQPGSGLEGLAQRVEALDGTLVIQSPPGGPTTVTARLPCAS